MSLLTALRARELSDARLGGAGSTVLISDLLEGSALDAHPGQLHGCCVLLLTNDQFTAALALIELDGLARRIVLCPPDLPSEHLQHVVQHAGVDVIVSDREVPSSSRPVVQCATWRTKSKVAGTCNPLGEEKTEWVLLTSGSTGAPKLVLHDLASLTGALGPVKSASGAVTWSTFYDIRRYGGLQVFFRAILFGASLVLSNAHESLEEFLNCAIAARSTHISGTPSHWRRALMSDASLRLQPEYVRLSGEIADQGILDHLKQVYPQARISHAFASTEAGLAMEVTDGLAGFPVCTLEHTPGVEMKVVEGSLRVRSGRSASRYLGDHAPSIRDADGFIDTGDLLDMRDGRYYFVGRRDGMINVGGLKVYAEEVEGVMNRHPAVHMSLVRAKKSPITGALVVADVVIKPDWSAMSGVELQKDLLRFCRNLLPPYKVPAAIQIVSSLGVAQSGKLDRCYA